MRSVRHLPVLVSFVLAALAAPPLMVALAHGSARAQPALPGAPQAESPAAPQNDGSDQAPRTVPGRAGPPLPGARARVLVLPVAVGDGPAPDPLLVTALVRGLSENPNWDVTSPASGDTLTPVPTPSVPEALLAEAEAALVDSGPARTENRNAEVVAALSPTMQKLLDAVGAAPLGPRGTEVVLKLGSALLAAQIGAGLDEDASTTAATLKRLLPERALGQEQGFSIVASALLAAASAPGVPVQLVSNPPGCRILVDGHVVGVAPAKLELRPDTKYGAQAHCGEGQAATESFLRVISVADRGAAAAAAEGGPVETPARPPVNLVLDAILPLILHESEGGVVLRFRDVEQRRAMEEAFVPRLAERFGVNNVVLASVGEFQSSPWLNGRLYLSSGYKNRHGLARTDPARAAALGRYLSTGRESPGVLNAEEAGQMVAASHTLRPLGPATLERTPWYKDAAAWSLVGAGALGLGLGLWADGEGEAKREEADLRTRNDPIRRDELQSEASTLKFWGGVGIYAGAVLVGTGIVLLALPEYEETRSAIYGLTPLPGGAAFSYAGRF